jgi:hypothetical protein
MTTDTFTLSRRALVEPDDQITSTRPTPPTEADGRATAQPRRSPRGAGQLLSLLLSDAGRQRAPDYLLLLGPNGGPLWTSRLH